MRSKENHWSSFTIKLDGRTLKGIREVFYSLDLTALKIELKKAEAIEDYESCIEIKKQIDNYKTI